MLLPPSEGKTSPADGPPVDLTRLSSPGLTPVRERVLDVLVDVSARPDAVRVLGVGASVADDVAHNTTLREAPTAPAAQVYTGVLYAAADLGGLDDDGAERGARSVRIMSALWGLLSPADAIPAYRLPIGAPLPGLERLPTLWREPLAGVLDPLAAEHLVVDCRSGDYTIAWRGAPRGTAGPGHVTVRVLSETDGVRTVVSHWAKQTRGLLTGHLLRRTGPDPSTPEELRDAAAEMIGDRLLDVGLEPRSGGRHVLSLVVPGLAARR